MRSYYLIILLLLSISALAQDATITVSYGQTTEKTVSIIISPNTPSIVHTLDSAQFVKTTTIDVSLPCCKNWYGWYCNTGYASAYNCGTINLCVKYDQETTADCKTLQNKKTQTVSFDTNKIIQKITFTYTGSRTVNFAYPQTQSTATQITINKIRLSGGGFAQIIRNLLSLRGTGPIKLKRVREIIDVTGYSGEVYVSSDDARAPAWFDDGTGISATTRTTTDVYDDFVLACLNIDQNKDAEDNPICDYKDEYNCALQNKDWFKGYCCGDAPYSPTNGCQWFTDKQAVCGKDSTGYWRWAALEDKGLISSLSGNCPTMQLVSDGTKFYTCTQNIGNIQGMPAITKINGKLTIEGHEYVCDSETIAECGGDSPYSPAAKTTGATLSINSQRNYCTKNGKWVVSLDGIDKESCTAAGLTWTGTKCCGETDDTLKTYEDTYTGQGTAGACYNNQFIPSGAFVGGDKKLISYRGDFYLCNPNLVPDQTEPATGTVFSGTGVTPTAKGPCGTPLLQALLTGTKPNIICLPSGDWYFTSSTDVHQIKSTAWTPITNEQRQGCCPENQCWDGKNCRNIGDYYTIEGRGFRCQ